MAEMDARVDTFYGEDVTYQRLKQQESTKIQNFLERRNPYDVLAKSENGKPDLKTIFTKLVRFLVKQDVMLTLLIDLDGGALEGLVTDLDSRVESNYEGNEFRIRLAERVDRSQEQIAAVGELYSERDGAALGEFQILAFHQNLEESAGIERSGDSDEETKLRQFVADEQACGPMRACLL
jgi:hypothetical protein